MGETIEFEVNVRSNLAGLHRMQQILRAPMGEGRGAGMISALRASVAREFAQVGWSRPEGGVDRWKETLPFGNRPEKVPLGGSGGTLARAWAGGTGGFTYTEPTRAGIGVSLPYAAMHRGGRGTEAGGKVTIIRPKKYSKGGLPAMFWYLGLKFGAWISPKKLERGLEVPSRPHATTNPALVQALQERLRAALLGGAA